MANRPVIRSWLFVPGNRPERFEKARTSGAHESGPDNEGDRAPTKKAPARAEVWRWLWPP